MKRLLFLFCSLVTLLVLSCTAEDIKNAIDQIKTDEQGKVPGLVGTYALDDGTGLTDTFISFDSDMMYEYKATGETKVLAEEYLWFTKNTDFSKHNDGKYSVSGDVLYCNGIPYGKIQIENNKIVLDGKTYTKFIGIKSERYSTISVQGELTQSISYAKQTLVFSVSVDRTIPSGKLMVDNRFSWISYAEIKDGILTIEITENNSYSTRTASIILSCAGAEDVLLQIQQMFTSSLINTQPYSQDVDYRGGNFSLTYTIANPREAATVTAVSQSDWITGIKIEENVVSYHVEENNSGSSRTGYVNLSYGNYASKSFPVYQSYTGPVISFTPESQTVEYTSGNYSFDFSVTNPRESLSFSAVSQNDWITDVQLDGNSVSYKVAENNSGSSRTGKIKLSYGSLTSKEFSITQNYSAPVIAFTPASQSVEYAGGNYSFSLSISKPREGASFTVVSQNNWITDVKQQGTTVNYKVAANHSVKTRNGAIKVSYGLGNTTYKTQSFGVSQSNEPISQLSLNKTILALNAASSETLVPTVTPSDAIFEWSSSNTKVAIVNNSGKVTAISNGTSTITLKALAQSGSNEGAKTATCSVTVTGAINLASSQTANCYIVSFPGIYNFPTYKGNSKTSVGKVSSVEVLWESFGTSNAPSKGDIISKVINSPSMVVFKTPSTLKNGNAVIAVKDASGNILWSWHIWVCNGYDPVATAQEYYNNAGTMMDRNIGATSATPGNVKALGLLYQWGRKDPFLGSSSISSNTNAASTLSWPSAVSSTSSNGTIAYAVKNPTTFIKYNSSNYDWHYTGSSSTDNTRWQSSKTIYDPCPPGWRVPDGGSSGVWSKAVNSSSSFSYNWDSTNKGMNFSGKFGSASTIWYPTAGILGRDDGSLGIVGYSGEWWSCTPTTRYAAYRLNLNGNGGVGLSGSDSRAYGRSVRCLQE